MSCHPPARQVGPFRPEDGLTTGEQNSWPYTDLHVKPYAERHVKVYADNGFSPVRLSRFDAKEQEGLPLVRSSILRTSTAELVTYHAGCEQVRPCGRSESGWAALGPQLSGTWGTAKD